MSSYPPVPYPPVRAVSRSPSSAPIHDAIMVKPPMQLTRHSTWERELLDGQTTPDSTVCTPARQSRMHSVPDAPVRARNQSRQRQGRQLSASRRAAESPASSFASAQSTSVTRKKKKATLTSAFKSPLIRRIVDAPSFESSSKAVELSTLEREIEILKQAKRYLLADELGTQGGESELRALCSKWHAAGRAAATMLWEHAPSFTPSAQTKNPHHSTDHRQQPRLPPTSTEASEYIASKMKESGKTRSETLQELTDEADEYLPTPDELRAKGGPWHHKASSRKRKRQSSNPELDGHHSDRFTEGDRFMSALTRGSMLDDDNVGSASEQWNVGHLMRIVGVDPKVFGWDDEIECFDD